MFFYLKGSDMFALCHSSVYDTAVRFKRKAKNKAGETSINVFIDA